MKAELQCSFWTFQVNILHAKLVQASGAIEGEGVRKRERESESVWRTNRSHGRELVVGDRCERKASERYREPSALLELADYGS